MTVAALERRRPKLSMRQPVDDERTMTNLRVHVDQNLCQGHTQCNFTAPELFEIRDKDGLAYVTVEVVPPGLEDLAQLAAASCPEQAIFFSEKFEGGEHGLGRQDP